jgi:ribosomal protein S19
MLEAEVLKHVMLKLSKLGSTMFRQNVGQAWAGSSVKVKGRTVVIEGAMPVTMGLFKGSSDLIGWTPVTITEDMVGKKVAIFTAVECKRSEGGRLSPDQKRFIDRVNGAGGIAGVASSDEEAANILERHLRSSL